MQLKFLSYEEFAGQDTFWQLNRTEFFDLNLVVGINSTGKTRTLNVINGLVSIISGELKDPFQSGSYSATWTHDGTEITYQVSQEAGAIVHEQLTEGAVTKLIRHKDGSGEIYYESEKKSLPFSYEAKEFAIQQRNDQLQHPFVRLLWQWASMARLYQFGSDFDKNHFLTADQVRNLMAADTKVSKKRNQNLVGSYITAFRKYGQQYDEAIIKSMAQFGFNIEEVGTDSAPLGLDMSVVSLFVREAGLSGQIFQHAISQGMFRALALAIHINRAVFEKIPALLLIDDVGEGLDYRRAGRTICGILELAKGNNIQVIMTTNDEFTMNHVPLEYWTILRRNGHVVASHNHVNAADAFKKHKYMGLNNFDFFTSDLVK